MAAITAIKSMGKMSAYHNSQWKSWDCDKSGRRSLIGWRESRQGVFCTTGLGWGECLEPWLQIRSPGDTITPFLSISISRHVFLALNVSVHLCGILSCNKPVLNRYHTVASFYCLSHVLYMRRLLIAIEETVACDKEEGVIFVSAFKPQLATAGKRNHRRIFPSW